MINIDLDIIEHTITESKIKNMTVKLKTAQKLDKIEIPAESLGKVLGVKFGDGKTKYCCEFELNNKIEELELSRSEFSFV